MKPQQIEATILGQSYVLACPPDGEQLLREAVSLVDREMSAIRDAGKVKARERMAVLAALNLAYQRAEHNHAVAQARPAAAGPSTGAASRDHEASGVDIEGLIRRVDAALGDDGQLL